MSFSFFSNWNIYFMLLHLLRIADEVYCHCELLQFSLFVLNWEKPLCTVVLSSILCSDGNNHILCTYSGLSDKLHLLLSVIVLSSCKVKVPFHTFEWFALSSKSKSFHCYFCLYISAEVSIYMKILVISVIFMCIQEGFIDIRKAILSVKDKK